MSLLWNPNFERAGQLYVESAEAQHGDPDLARWEAEEWWRIFMLLLDEEDNFIGTLP